jgi:integrase
MSDQPKRLKKERGVNIFQVTIKGVPYWRVISPKSGKGRVLRTFRSPIEARRYYERELGRVRDFGRRGLRGLSTRQERDALIALDALKPFENVSLLAAVEFYARHHATLDTSVTVNQALAKLLEAKKLDGASKRYLGDLKARLNRFASDFEDQTLCSIGSDEIGDWLRALRLSPSSRNTFHMRLSVLFSFGVERRWVSSNPLTKGMRAKEIQHEPGIISPEQFSALLLNSSPETRPYWILGGFCGIRRAEIERLDWRDIHWEERSVEINPAKSKTAARRLCELGDAALAWLSPYRTNSGPICPGDLQRRLLTDRERAGVTEWPANALRHSYASYHLAAFSDAAKLSLQMGHMKASIVFNHYRQRVRVDVAKQRWAIFPDQAENVIKIA